MMRQLLTLCFAVVPLTVFSSDHITAIQHKLVYLENSTPLTELSLEISSPARSTTITLAQAGTLIEEENAERAGKLNEDSTVAAFNFKTNTKGRTVCMVAITPQGDIVIFRDLAARLREMMAGTGAAINFRDITVDSVDRSTINVTTSANGVPEKVDMDIAVTLSSSGALEVQSALPASR